MSSQVPAAILPLRLGRRRRASWVTNVEPRKGRPNIDQLHTACFGMNTLPGFRSPWTSLRDGERPAHCRSVQEPEGPLDGAITRRRGRQHLRQGLAG